MRCQGSVVEADSQEQADAKSDEEAEQCPFPATHALAFLCNGCAELHEILACEGHVEAYKDAPESTVVELSHLRELPV